MNTSTHPDEDRINSSAEERFRLVVESAPMGLIIVNSQGRIVLVNAQAEKLFGYRRDELLSTSIEALIPERFHSTHISYRSEYFVDPQLRAMGNGRELSGIRKDGSEFPVEVGLTPIEMLGRDPCDGFNHRHH